MAGGNGSGSNANQLTPVSVCMDAAGYIYVADANNNRIQKFPPGSTSSTSGVTVAHSIGSDWSPNSVYVDAAGNIYVGDIAKYRVIEFPAGAGNSYKVIAGGNGFGTSTNQFQEIQGICADNAGNVYAADAANSWVLKFPAGSTSSTNGIIVAGGNGEGTNANQLSWPFGICLDNANNLYVADASNNRVQKFPAGSTSSTNGVTVAGGNLINGSGAAQLNWPNSVAVDAAGNIYVSDKNNNRVQKFLAGSTAGTNGITVAGGNGSGSNPNQLNTPSGVCLMQLGMYMWLMPITIAYKSGQ